MFNPEMMRMAQDMMSNMSPEQLAAMQRQAASMSPEMMQAAMLAAQNANPDDLRRAGQQAATLTPEAMAAQARTAAAQLPARDRMLLTASTTLKREGNELFGRGDHGAAAEKYERAIRNLEQVSGSEAAELRLGCRNNLGACRLALGEWAAAREACDAVLAEQPSNKKALYRRGQALLALGKARQAEMDLSAALSLADAGDREAIQEKLDASREAARKEGENEGSSKINPEKESSSGGEEDGGIEEVEVIERGTAAEATPSSTAHSAHAPGPSSLPGSIPPGDPRAAYTAAEMLEKNPDKVKAAMDALNSMSDEQLAMQMAAGGAPPGMTPEMARSAASMVQHLSPEQLRMFADQAGSLGASQPSTRPVSPPTNVSSTTAAPPPPVPTQDPKAMADMLRGMDPEMLQSMAEASGAGAGLPPGTKLDASMLQAAASMMESMRPEDMARMMETMGPGAPGGAAPPGAFANNGDIASKLGDPAMLKTMRNMLKSMPPEALEEMGKQTGMKISPQMVDKLANMSDKTVDRIAWVLRIAMAIVAFIKRCWAFARGQQGLVLGVILLFVAIFMRWAGWI